MAALSDKPLNSVFMKRTITLFAIALFAVPVLAQVPRSTDPVTTSLLPLSGEVPTYHESSDLVTIGDAPEAAGDIIWEEDFANGIPNTWTLLDSSGICEWKHTFVGSQGFWNGTSPVIASSTAANGFIICDPDSANDTNFGQPSGTTYQYLSSWIITEGINTMGYNDVRLQFTQYFRMNNDIGLHVFVGTAGPNGPWDLHYNVRGNIASNQASEYR